MPSLEYRGHPGCLAWNLGAIPGGRAPASLRKILPEVFFAGQVGRQDFLFAGWLVRRPGRFFFRGATRSDSPAGVFCAASHWRPAGQDFFFGTHLPRRQKHTLKILPRWEPAAPWAGRIFFSRGRRWEAWQDFFSRRRRPRSPAGFFFRATRRLRARQDFFWI